MTSINIQEINIRPYTSSDRQGLRDLCCDTANMGAPLEEFFLDRELIADLLTRYYTDYEAQYTLIAEYKGQLVGYLTGCLNTAKSQRITLFKILPLTLISALFHKKFWHIKTWRTFKAALRSFLKGGFNRTIALDQYPAHLHINIHHNFRGKKIGSLLFQKFIEQARSAGCHGVHAATRVDNPSACRFFEEKGFSYLSKHCLILPMDHTFYETYSVVYAKKI